MRSINQCIYHKSFFLTQKQNTAFEMLLHSTSLHMPIIFFNADKWPAGILTKYSLQDPPCTCYITSIFERIICIFVVTSSTTGMPQNSPSSWLSSLYQPSAGSFVISDIPNDSEPIKSLREVLSQSQTSKDTRLEKSSGARSLKQGWNEVTHWQKIYWHVCDSLLRALIT